MGRWQNGRDSIKNGCLITDCLFYYKTYIGTSSVSHTLTDKTCKLIIFLFSLLLSLFKNGSFWCSVGSSFINIAVYSKIYRRTSKFSKGGNFEKRVSDIKETGQNHWSTTLSGG